jgi:hypothetical protein
MIFARKDFSKSDGAPVRSNQLFFGLKAEFLKLREIKWDESDILEMETVVEMEMAAVVMVAAVEKVEVKVAAVVEVMAVDAAETDVVETVADAVDVDVVEIIEVAAAAGVLVAVTI